MPSKKEADAVLDKIFALLKKRLRADPYAMDGLYACEIRKLPVGLRAMAATHWLDLSLCMDSVDWHFGNFGEDGLVRETEAGLRELGLTELADVFRSTHVIVKPYIAKARKSDMSVDELAQRDGHEDQLRQLRRKAWDLGKRGAESAIYSAWVQYAKAHPDKVFVHE